MDELLSYIQMFRVVWIKGRVGFGKTALSVYIAQKMIESGLADGAISNFPTILPVHIVKDDGMLHNRVIIFDEAWQFVDARTTMSNERAYGAFARKYNAFFLLPSVQPVDKRLRQITIAPMFRNIFTGATTWEAIIEDGATDAKKTRVRFSFNPKSSYGLYSTAYIPINDGGIMDRFQRTFDDLTGVTFGTGEHTYNNALGQDNETEPINAAAE